MHYIDLKRVTEAPKRGQMLAYTRTQVIFQSYADLDEVKQILEDAEILELHLFDDGKEYRSIASRSPRFKDGVIETVVNGEADNENNIYSETVASEEEYGTAITVLNHIHYDEKSGMADIDNYRLKMGGDHNGK